MPNGLRPCPYLCHLIPPRPAISNVHLYPPQPKRHSSHLEYEYDRIQVSSPDCIGLPVSEILMVYQSLDLNLSSD